MGVLVSHSILMKSGKAERGVRADRALSSEGKGDGNDSVLGVFSFGSFGRVVVVAAIFSKTPSEEVVSRLE